MYCYCAFECTISCHSFKRGKFSMTHSFKTFYYDHFHEALCVSCSWGVCVSPLSPDWLVVIRSQDLAADWLIEVTRCEKLGEDFFFFFFLFWHGL